MKQFPLTMLVLPILALAVCSGASAQPVAPLAAPGFHHLHLNTVDATAALSYYTRAFPSTSKTTWGGFPALASPNNVLILFTQVAKPPVSDAEATAYWHFGWRVVDARKAVDFYRANAIPVAPFYTGDGDSAVAVSSDTWPYPPGINGRTQAQIAEAKAANLQPRGVGGNGFVFGPDGAAIEFAGNAPERFDHVHMYQEDAVCAQLWYQQHLNATARALAAGAAMPTAADCKTARAAEATWPSLVKSGTYRGPSGGVTFGDVAMNWYPRQTDVPLAPTRGRLMDHVGLAVADLDAWVAKLTAEKVRFLRRTYKLGDTRAVMIEGPSREAIELVEVK